jgi:hypothetical protein
MIEDVDYKRLPLIVGSYLFESEVAYIDGWNNVVFGAEAYSREFLVVLHDNNGTVRPNWADEVGVFVYLHNINDVELPEMEKSRIRSWVELSIEYLAKHFWNALC